MKLSIVIPCYNEANNIQNVMASVKQVNIPGFTKEIIIVDDGSSDATPAILSEYHDDEVKVHLSPRNFGKGIAIKTALSYVSGDIVIIQDADFEYEPEQIPDILKPFTEHGADVVYGSRFLGEIKGMRFRNWLANKLLTWTANLLYRAGITDEATCYKAFKTDVIKSIHLKCTRFEFCPEVTAKLRKRKYEIVEVPIRYSARSTSEGKKIKWSDAFVAMWTLFKYRFMD